MIKKDVKRLMYETVNLGSFIALMKKENCLDLFHLSNMLQAWYKIQGLEANTGIKKHWEKFEGLIGSPSQVLLTGIEYTTRVWGLWADKEPVLLLLSLRGLSVQVRKECPVSDILRILSVEVCDRLYDIASVTNEESWKDYCRTYSISPGIEHYVLDHQRDKDMPPLRNWVYINQILRTAKGKDVNADFIAFLLGGRRKGEKNYRLYKKHAKALVAKGVNTLIF